MPYKGQPVNEFSFHILSFGEPYLELNTICGQKMQSL